MDRYQFRRNQHAAECRILASSATLRDPSPASRRRRDLREGFRCFEARSGRCAGHDRNAVTSALRFHPEAQRLGSLPFRIDPFFDDVLAVEVEEGEVVGRNIIFHPASRPSVLPRRLQTARFPLIQGPAIQTKLGRREGADRQYRLARRGRPRTALRRPRSSVRNLRRVDGIFWGWRRLPTRSCA